MKQPTTDSTKNLIHHVFDAFNDRNYDTLATLHSSDVILHENGSTYRGYDAVEEHLAGLLGKTETEFTIGSLIAEGGSVACRYTISGVDGSETDERSSLCFVDVDGGEIGETWVESS